MRDIIIETGASSAASTLHARRHRAGARAISLTMALDGASVLHTARSPHAATVVRHTDEGWMSAALGFAVRQWAAMRRKWRVARAAADLKRMSDERLSDIGVPRSDIDFVVRHGRSGDTGVAAEY